MVSLDAKISQRRAVESSLLRLTSVLREIGDRGWIRHRVDDRVLQTGARLGSRISLN